MERPNPTPIQNIVSRVLGIFGSAKQPGFLHGQGQKWAKRRNVPASSYC